MGHPVESSIIKTVETRKKRGKKTRDVSRWNSTIFCMDYYNHL